jgi:hypothetical protein
VIDTSFTGWPTERTIRCSDVKFARSSPDLITQIPAWVSGPARPEQIFGVGAAAPGGGTRMAPSPTRGNPVFLDRQLLGVLVGPPLNEDPIAAI